MNGGELVSLTNYIISNRMKLPFPRCTKTFDAGGLFLFYYMTCATTLLPLMVVTITLLEVDVFYVLLDNFVLSNPQYRPISTILISLGISMCLTSIGLTTLLRNVGVLLFQAICLVVVLEKHVRVLGERGNSEDKVLHLYQQLWVLVSIGNSQVSRLIMVGIFCTQFLLALMPWLTIRGYQEIPFVAAIVSALAYIGLLGISIFALNMLVESQLQSLKPIADKGKLFRRFRRSRRGLYFYLKWKCLQPITVKCGGFCVIDKQIVVHYLSVLNSNCSNVILLID